MSLEIIYTFSDRGRMVEKLEESLEETSEYIDEDKIRVFMTPPTPSESKQDELSDKCNLVNADNISEPIVIGRGPRRFGEKIHLTESPADNVIFMDCDVKPMMDIEELIDPSWMKDFDFMARREPAFHFCYDIEDKKEWAEMFHKLGKDTVIPMVHAGFMIFKNGLHKEIKGEWKELLNKEIDCPAPLGYMSNDQIAISVSLADRDIRINWADRFILSKSRQGEDRDEGWVYHG